MVAVADIHVDPRRPEELEPLIGGRRIADLHADAAGMRALLRGRTIWNVNSTASGGGVVEMLQMLVSYARGAQIDVRWCVIAGDPGFFEITKRVHNRLHGWPGTGHRLDQADAAHYAEVLRENAQALRERVQPGDVVVLHDPQVLGLADALADHGACVIWRCHVGADAPNRHTEEAWRFLRPHLATVRAVVVSRAAHLPPGVPRSSCFVIPPSIDPLAPKNQNLSPDGVGAIVGRMGLIAPPPRGRPTFHRGDGTVGEVERAANVVASDGFAPAGSPLVVQVSRWDRLKDMPGVMRAFARINAPADARLALVGPDVAGVTDDPEGAGVLDECKQIWENLPAGTRSRVLLVTLPMDDLEENGAMVNAIQRHADVVRAEEPGRRVRAHGRRSDVEGATRHRIGGRRDLRSDRAGHRPARG